MVGGHARVVLAKGPAFNNRNCINPTHKHNVDEEDDDKHRHTIIRTDFEAEKEKNDDRSYDAYIGVMIGVQREN
eukprot:8588953-Heterocapsa_arctica.AAC.1